jgi:hypothetical protein
MADAKTRGGDWRRRINPWKLAADHPYCWRAATRRK